MKYLSKTPFVITTLLCGLMAMVGVVIFILLNTTMQKRIIFDTGDIDKLSGAVLMLTLLPTMMVIWILNWDRISKYAELRMQYSFKRHPSTRKINIAALYKIWCFGVVVFSALNLYFLVSGCLMIVNKQ